MRFGIFGCGNMGRALVLGIKARFPDSEFYLYTPSQTKAQELAQQVSGIALTNLLDMPRDLDWYFLAFKPQSLDEFNFKFNSDSKVLSVLAGVKTEKLKAKFNITNIARLMPNTPSAIGLGANLLYLSKSISTVDALELENQLSSTGTIFPIKLEQDLDLATAFSGSGPALIFEMARIFEAELNRMTEGRLPSKDIINKTFFGSAALMNSEGNAKTSFLELRDQVTSKKGVTFEALEVLRESHMQEIMKKAFEAAYKRTIELSQ